MKTSIPRLRAAHRDDMAGYALVAWSRDGAVSSAFKVGTDGAIGSRMLPDFVRSALIDHVANS